MLRRGPLVSPTVSERWGRGKALAVLAQWLPSLRVSRGMLNGRPASSSGFRSSLSYAAQRVASLGPRSRVRRSPSRTTQAVPAPPVALVAACLGTFEPKARLACLNGCACGTP